jgi:hypothetical protein
VASEGSLIAERALSWLKAQFDQKVIEQAAVRQRVWRLALCADAQ